MLLRDPSQGKSKPYQGFTVRQNNEQHPNSPRERPLITGRSLGLFCVSAEEVNVTKQNAPFRFTDEEMEIAKATDLPDLLEHLGYHVKQVGQFYTTREMDSLRIKNRRTWRRYSSQQAGDASTFLQEFCGKGFREAVDYLLEFNGGRARDSPVLSPRAPPQPEERPEFVLPPANGDNRRVFA